MTLYLVIQGLVTVALLAFGYLMRDVDRTIATLVVTAAVAYWLGEGPRVGRAVVLNGRYQDRKVADDAGEAGGGGA